MLSIFAAQGRRGESGRAFLERFFRAVPLFGSARQNLALARLAAALEALISAGVSIIESWDLAATASGSPALRRAVLAGKPKMLTGQTPAEVVNACPRFPEMFAKLYLSGEVSGKLDESLRHLHSYYQEEGTRKLHAVAQWTPRIV